MATWPMQPPANRIFRLNDKGMTRIVLLVVLVVWLGALGILVANRQNVFDWYQLRNYQAPTEIANLAVQDTMTPQARKIFYVNHASIEDKSTFSKHCPNNGGEQTIVLGCYHSNQAGISLMSVTDSRLDGVEQVTAAHEMLHSAYDRLSSADKNKVNAMLLDYYNHDLHDARIRSTMDAYKKSEPNDVVNEMHSVFGTEITNLPPGLEHYYTRYFTDRSQVAAFAAQYQAAFTSRQATLTQDDSQLASLKSRIDTTEADLKSRQAAINAQQATLLSERNSGALEAYNAGVPAYNQQIDAYNSEVKSVQSLVGQYNQLVADRNAVAFEEDQLVNDLSNSSAPISH